MDAKKECEEGWEEPEVLGPYQLQEQVPQTGFSQGELYRARHETSGATALVLRPATDDGEPPLPDWRVRCVSSASPGYLALEVEESPWSVAPDKHSVEALVFMFEGVRDGVRRMARAFPSPSARRFPWRPGLALVGAAAVCILAFALMSPTPVPQSPGVPDEPVASAEPAPMSHEVPTDTLIPLTGDSTLMGISDAAPSVFARSVPDKPYKGQRRPPCKPRIEVEIKGGCWFPHELKAPCPEPLYEYQGGCYMVSMKHQPLPLSLGQ